jgi:hemerythrin-like metal-binding protein
MWIQWHSGHAVGIESIDSKQRDLLHRTNRVVETVRGGRVDEAVTRLELLRAAAAAQFADEETRLRDAGSPSLERHALEHERLLADLDDLADDLTRYGLAAVQKVRFTSWLPRWIDIHVARTHCDLSALGSSRSAPALPARVAAAREE